jgi:hypothetical protein
MPSSHVKEERVRELAALAEGYGKILAGEAYGPEGPGLDVDLATMEDLAVSMQQALLKGMCQALTRQQARRLPETQPCPECGWECAVEQPDPASDEQSRPMRLRGGSFQLAEPRCYCRPCRRSFFPSADRAED